MYKIIRFLPLICLIGLINACKTAEKPGFITHYKQEKHLKNIRQLTFGGDNAEAYWSFDNKNLVFQSNNKGWGLKCDQIFTMKAEQPTKTKGGAYPTPQMLSTGNGRTTCAYYMPDNKSIIYASTHKYHTDCPAEAERTHGAYVWKLYPEFDIYQADLKGNIIKTLTNTTGYDAEATVSPDGKKIVFTSTRTGDPELFTMNLDGSEVKQVTFDLGYDGGAFFIPDSKQLVFRASRPTKPEEVEKYKALLAKDLVEPTSMELFMVNIDGSDLRQITHLGGANWAPFMHPSGKKILFSSNHHTKKGYPFNLFMINIDGTGLEQITFDTVFDSFPMFSPDGKKLIFGSNRNNGGSRDTNLFLANWKD